jgi:hypothetical protein
MNAEMSAKYPKIESLPTFTIEKSVNPSDFDWMQGDSEDPSKLPF